jgi:hypothetical protein
MHISDGTSLPVCAKIKINLCLRNGITQDYCFPNISRLFCDWYITLQIPSCFLLGMNMHKKLGTLTAAVEC